MEHFIDIIQQWGYIIVLFGSMIEGESIIIPACIMAYMGHLSIFKIAIIAFLGTLFADQGLYYFGRYYGEIFLNKFPKLKPSAEKAFKLLHKWDYKFILSFRFIYGIRMISPIVIGAAGIEPRRFIPLNLIAAIAWTITSCTVGYFLGGVIEVIGYAIVERYLLGVALFLLAIVIIAGYFAWKKLHSHHDQPVNEVENHDTPNPSSTPHKNGTEG